MVVKVMWIQSWITVSISLCVLMVLVLFVLFCLCSTSFFRRFSNAALINPTFKFNGPDSEKILTAYEQSKSLPIERDLMDSLDIQKQFNQSVLQIDNNYVHIDQDDAKSCRSLDSRHSFYSIYPFTRSHSVADTMKSAYSGPDSLEDC
ncbi:PREDICTED: uncharacterized protein LOC108558132 isoform X3 [Nicrophorus vespilloides]|uniref:Uncharacterized protein LOC108558132 isoform X3 n=1 Tax=Nicrophorus vespilloides TaxID=110193 RepID=A0ABM1M790_NICVS|nr:PREDICTED: uncharacterized protein LOC108558132 isoform X3 [Nicrophorus vespilloides]